MCLVKPDQSGMMNWCLNAREINTMFGFIINLYFYFSTRDQDQATNAEDVLFDMFKNEDTGLLAVGKFLAVSNLLVPPLMRYQFHLKFKIYVNVMNYI